MKLTDPDIIIIKSLIDSEIGELSWLRYGHDSNKFKDLVLEIDAGIKDLKAIRQRLETEPGSGPGPRAPKG